MTEQASSDSLRAKKFEMRKIESGDGYIGPDDCWYDSKEAVMQAAVLHFCTCGHPEDNLAYIRDGLEHIASDAPFEEWVVAGNALFGNDRARYFFYYWANQIGLTDHGGSVPGWLTDTGEALLEVLKSLDLSE